MCEYLFRFGSFVVNDKVRKFKIREMISIQKKGWMERFNVRFQFMNNVWIFLMFLYYALQFLVIKFIFPYFVQSGSGS
jgi:hypothetical protein